MSPQSTLFWCILINIVLYLTKQTTSQCLVVWVTIDDIDSTLDEANWEGVYTKDGTLSNGCPNFSTSSGNTLQYTSGSWHLQSTTSIVQFSFAAPPTPPCDPPLSMEAWTTSVAVTNDTVITLTCSISFSPSSFPSKFPSKYPTTNPTIEPTSVPSGEPTLEPTTEPTTAEPTSVPTTYPTMIPSTPTTVPSINPTKAPSKPPTSMPSQNPVPAPTKMPTDEDCSRIVVSVQSVDHRPSAIDGIYYRQHTDYYDNGYPWYLQQSSGTEANPGPTNYAEIYWKQGYWEIADLSNGIQFRYQGSNPSPISPIPPHSEFTGNPWTDLVEGGLVQLQMNCGPLTVNPTSVPTAMPSTGPTKIPTIEPTTEPTRNNPTAVPTTKPTILPTEISTTTTAEPAKESFLDVLTVLEWIIIASLLMICCLVTCSLYIWRYAKIDAANKEMEAMMKKDTEIDLQPLLPESSFTSTRQDDKANDNNNNNNNNYGKQREPVGRATTSPAPHTPQISVVPPNVVTAQVVNNQNNAHNVDEEPKAMEHDLDPPPRDFINNDRLGQDNWDVQHIDKNDDIENMSESIQKESLQINVEANNKIQSIDHIGNNMEQKYGDFSIKFNKQPSIQRGLCQDTSDSANTVIEDGVHDNHHSASIRRNASYHSQTNDDRDARMYSKIEDIIDSVFESETKNEQQNGMIQCPGNTGNTSSDKSGKSTQSNSNSDRGNNHKNNDSNGSNNISGNISGSSGDGGGGGDDGDERKRNNNRRSFNDAEHEEEEEEDEDEDEEGDQNDDERGPNDAKYVGDIFSNKNSSIQSIEQKHMDDNEEKYSSDPEILSVQYIDDETDGNEYGHQINVSNKLRADAPSFKYRLEKIDEFDCKHSTKIENISNANRKLSLDPHYLCRARGNIYISRTLTAEIIPSMVKEVLPNIYSFMDKAVAFLYVDIAETTTTYDIGEILILNYNFHAKKTNDTLYCVIERQNEVKNRNYKWKMLDTLFTASNIQDKYPMIRLNQLPKSLYLNGTFIHRLNHKHKIQDVLLQTEAIQLIISLTQWNKLKIFNKYNNKQDFSLNISKQEFVKTLESEIITNINGINLIPIILFNDNNDIIHAFIQIVKINETVDIGISYEYIEEMDKVQAVAIHVDKEQILQQHQLIVPDHMHECHCLDNFNSNINAIKICNLTEADNKLKELNKKIDGVKQENINLKQQIYTLSQQVEKLRNDNTKQENINLKQKIYTLSQQNEKLINDIEWKYSNLENENANLRAQLFQAQCAPVIYSRPSASYSIMNQSLFAETQSTPTALSYGFSEQFVNQPPHSMQQVTMQSAIVTQNSANQ